MKLLSSLEKIFSDEAPSATELDSLTLLTAEKGNVQFVFQATENADIPVSINSGVPYEAFTVKEIPSSYAIAEDNNSVVLRGGKPGNYPDLLMPLTDFLSTEKGKWYSIWVKLSAVKAGNFSLTVKAGEEEKTLPVKVLECVLPEQELLCTHWFHSDCLSTYYKIDVFSDEYWRISENFIKTAVEHGINTILTPLFTPPLDTAVGGERPTVQLVNVEKKENTYTFGFEKLGKWIDMCMNNGVKYLEMSHLFTQWGANHAPKIMSQTSKGYRRIFGWETNSALRGYRNFLLQFSRALTPYLREKGVWDRCIFHVSDEPSILQFYSYRRCAKIIEECFPGCRRFDALSDFGFYKKGVVPIPVPCCNNIDDFMGKVPELWTYYCCGQYMDNVPNRFFCMPSVRNRVLGILMYAYDVKGFLQWGYNFWYTQYSLRAADPFTESDAGGKFPSGDSYVVYPAPDGSAWCSLRFEVFYEATEDMRACKKLEELTSREYVLGIIGKNLPKKLSFKDYPVDAQWLLGVRANINAEIASKTENY